MGCGIRVDLDAAAARPVEAGGMNEKPLTLTVYIRPAGEHLAGCVLAGGRSLDFAGRIGLICAIDALVADARPGAPDPTATDPKEHR